MSAEQNIIFGTYNTFHSRTGGTVGSVVLQAGPGENLLLNSVVSSINGRALYTATTAQIIPSATATPVIFPTSDYNTFGTNITYNTAGTFTNTAGTTMYLQTSYSVRSTPLLSSGDAGPASLQIYLQKNTQGAFYAQELKSVSTTSALALTGSQIIQLAPSDFFSVYVRQTNTASTVASISADASTSTSLLTLYQLI